MQTVGKLMSDCENAIKTRPRGKVLTWTLVFRDGKFIMRPGREAIPGDKILFYVTDIRCRCGFTSKEWNFINGFCHRFIKNLPLEDQKNESNQIFD